MGFSLAEFDFFVMDRDLFMNFIKVCLFAAFIAIPFSVFAGGDSSFRFYTDDLNSSSESYGRSSPTALTLEQIISSLVKDFEGQKDPQYPLIDIKFQGISTQLHYTFDGNTVDLILSGAQGGDSSYDIVLLSCLLFKIDLSEGFGDLLTLKTDRRIHCPLPDERKGSFILDLVDAISKSLSLSRVSLVDASKVKCHKNNQSVHLKFLKIMQNGKGWYESHGYTPVFVPKFENYIESIAKLRDFPLSKIQDIKSFNEFNLIIEDFKKYAQDQYEAEKLSGFLTWLWDNDCSKYSKFEEKLFVMDKSSNDELEDLFHFVNYNAINLSKVF